MPCLPKQRASITTEEVAERALQPDLSAIPLYDDFINHHEDYVRIHIHLVGLVSTFPGEGAEALGKRRNRLGRPRVVDAVADPYVTVNVLGQDTGSTEHFPIGSHSFPTLTDCQTPVWDSKCMLLSKKDALQGIEFTLWDDNSKAADEALFKIVVTKDELPPITPLEKSEWTFYTKTADTEDARTSHSALEFSIMMTDGSERIASLEDMQTMNSGENGYTFEQFILLDETACDDDNALLQSWKHPQSTRAVLWILGRNDCFMHPHVAEKLFLSQGYDLYVLNYKMNGACRQKGWVQDPHYNSHNKFGDFNVYIGDIQQSLDHIHETKEYDKVLGYAHSTGGPVLLNYLMEKGDDDFDGFLFNSPFLDWGFVGGDMIEFVLEHTGLIFERFGGMDKNAKVGVVETPEGETPLVYLNTNVVLSDWSARLWSLYYYDWHTRPLYHVPMTIGFAQGVTEVHEKMEALHKAKKPITAKPFLCITSRGDDVLKAPETLSRADWIGPGRWEIELNDNGHDIFLSYDKNDTDMAIDMCLTWMKNRKFA